MASNYSSDPNNIVSLGNPVTPQSGQDSGPKVPEYSASNAHPYSSDAAQGQSPQTSALVITVVASVAYLLVRYCLLGAIKSNNPLLLVVWEQSIVP